MDNIIQQIQDYGVPQDQLIVLVAVTAIGFIPCFCFCFCEHCCHDPHSILQKWGPDGKDPVTGLPNGKDQLQRKDDHRHVTDRCGCSLFLLSLGLFWAMMIFAGFHGRPLRLVHGVDYQGLVCGIDSGVATKPFMYWCGTRDQDNPWTDDGTNLPGQLNFHSKTCVEACPTSANPITVACLQRNELEESRHNLADLTSFGLTVNQKIVAQTSYPTIASNRMCLPDGDADLQYQILTNALGSGRSSGRRIASILNGWWVLLVSGLVAVFINYVFLYMLGKMAGLVLFCQMVSTVGMTIIVGVYFLMALGFWDNNLDGYYQKINPWYHTFPDSGLAAVICSTFTGVFFVIVGIGIGLATFSEASHVDETVGLVVAAMDCVWAEKGCITPGGKPVVGKGTGDLLRLPMIISLMLMTCSALLLYGVTYVLSIATTDASMISYNGEYVLGIYRRLEFAWYTDYLLFFYVFMGAWILEFCLSLGQFVAAYCTVSWYYAELKVTRGPALDFAGNGKAQQVRVVGVDAITDKRQAFVTTDADTGQKVMKMFIGKKGPGAKDSVPQAATIWTKPGAHNVLRYAFGTALGYHAGSLAKGSLCIGLTRPLRILPNVITSIMVREGATRQTHPLLGKSERCCNVFGFMATCIDALIGYLSKDAYIEMVLSPPHEVHTPFVPGFWHAADEAQEKVIQYGGVVAFFMGACALFDFVWAVFMFCLSFILTLFIVAAVPCFTDPANVMFVADPGCLAVVSAILNTMIGYTFIMVVSHVSDTLVYTFADQRKGDKDAAQSSHSDGNFKKFLPISLGYLVGDETKSPEADFKPEGTRAGHFWNHGTHMFTHALGGHEGGHH